MPVLAGGNSAAELETQRVILERAQHRPISTLGCSLRELVGVLHRSALVVSLDSGPMHMSVALGTPVVALMGYNDPRRVGPYRRFNDLIVNAFGSDGPITHRHRPGRMQHIQVRDVIEKVQLWQQRYWQR
jgi:heptosyltransferase I